MNEDPVPPTDAEQLGRFLTAQAPVYEQALDELRCGCKRTHWMWFVFPQLAGLGRSATAQFYAIPDVDEAKAYVRHPVLGSRLLEAADAILSAPAGRSAREILGDPDDMKLRSCATLFSAISPADSIFHRILDRFFGGQPDVRTLELLRLGREVP
ncbi:MAG: calpastatin [Verrucomicrobiia bacterium Tous-C4TDCM]|nr:MAG: calpastatin [Verrucomicrobiae bacterium Tous-C4TDCM]